MQASPVLAAVCVLGALLLRPAGGQLSPGESCPAGDRQQLSACLAAGLEKLRPFFRSGIPENNIPPGDPLRLNEITFSDGVLDAKYTNVLVRGFSTFVLHRLDVDPQARKVIFNLTVPVANLAGDYDVSGTFLGASINSRGNFASEIRMVDILGVGDLVVERSQGGRSDHVQMTNLKVHLNIGRTHHEVNYIANSDRDRIIGETVRRLVTKNDKILLREVWPKIEQKVAEVMSRLVNRVLTIIPVSSVANHVPQSQGALQGRGFSG